jgi:hypothetical protein
MKAEKWDGRADPVRPARPARVPGARLLAVTDPARARQMGIGRTELTRYYKDGGLVDVNHVPAREPPA